MRVISGQEQIEPYRRRGRFWPIFAAAGLAMLLFGAISFEELPDPLRLKLDEKTAITNDAENGDSPLAASHQSAGNGDKPPDVPRQVASSPKSPPPSSQPTAPPLSLPGMLPSEDEMPVDEKPRLMADASQTPTIAQARPQRKHFSQYPDLYRSTDRFSPPTTEGQYQVGINDELEITLFWENQVQKENYPVQENGFINYPMIGQVQVSGNATSQIATIIEQRLEKYILNHTVNVRVAKYNSQFVRASGAIQIRGADRTTGPGYHALKRGITTLSEFLLDIGDTTADADRNAISLVRKNGDKEIVDLDKILNGEARDPILQDGDVVQVPSKQTTRNVIYVTGAVNSPGVYDWREGLKISEALLGAGNPTHPPALVKVTIVGENGVKTLFNYKTFMEKQARQQDISLQPQDMIFVDAQAPPAAKIIGEVREGGTYPLDENANTLLDFILNKAGGISEKSDTSRIEIFRREEGRLVYNLKELIDAPHAKQDFVLKDGDFIVVPSIEDKKNKIWVLGQVNLPGAYFLEGEPRLIDALRLAGGHRPGASLDRVTLKRGGLQSAQQVINVAEAMKTGDLTDNPLLQPDDIIYVPESFASTMRDLASNVLPLIQIATFTQLLRRGN
ncbi:MAG: SLBB domain-containing protein [Candidatus Poribacteria bacterium]|nr:SLBB domain-containing protein [Candidatus Poribacteria bacterium]